MDKGRQEASHGQVKHEEPPNTDQQQSMKEPETQNQTYYHPPTSFNTNPDISTAVNASRYIKMEEDYKESSSSKSADPIGVTVSDQKNMKEEAESTLINKIGDVSTLGRQENVVVKPKRSHEELLDDNNASIGKSYRHISPAKKKGANASDKQPTIFSYFGRS